MDTVTVDKAAAKYQGGLSDWLAADPYFKDYVAGGHPHGYLGHGCRKAWLDAVVEDELRLAGLTVPEVVEWLTSVDGRHTGDALEDYRASQRADVRRKLRQDFKHIKDRVQAWKHPDHDGSWGGTLRLLHRLLPWKYDEAGRLRADYGGRGVALDQARGVRRGKA